jgi:hypothetical protein
LSGRRLVEKSGNRPHRESGVIINRRELVVAW